MLSIIMAIEDGDDRNFVMSLYKRYEKSLYITAAKVLEDSSYAEDCVHDTIYAVIENLRRFKGYTEDAQIRFMVICCRNAAINKYNIKNKRSRTVSKEEKEEREGVELSDTEIDVCDVVVISDMKRQLREKIALLDTKYKDVITMMIEFDFNTKEISRYLHISQELVRQRYKRGKELLRKIAGKELYGLLKD